MNGESRSEPLSIEVLLKKQKEEKEAASKPKFLTKEQRAQLAIERRSKEIKEEKEREELKRREREALEREAGELERQSSQQYHGGGHHGGYGGQQGGGRYNGRYDDRDRGYDRNDRDGGRHGGRRDYNRGGGGGDRRDDRRNGPPPSGPSRGDTYQNVPTGPRADRSRGGPPPTGPSSSMPPPPPPSSAPPSGPTSLTDPSSEFVPALTDNDLTAIRSRYLGVDKKKRKIRKMNDRKFVFDWDAQDDTLAEDSLAAVGSNRQGALVAYGRGHIAGMDDYGGAPPPARNTGSKGSGSGGGGGGEPTHLADAMERRKALKQGYDDRHWTEKPLGEMKERDWRIFREDFSISARGGNIPHPLRSWEESEIPKTLLECIEKIGYKEPSPIQRQAIPIGLQSRDIIGIAETGSGKTAAFVIPMLAFIGKLPIFTDENRHLGPYALILAPTRELAQQIESEAKKFATPLGYKCVSIVGGRAVEEQQFNLREGAEIIIATPGRLKDVLERHVLVLSQCRYIVMDEADRMVHLGFEVDLTFILDQLPMDVMEGEDAERMDVDGETRKGRTRVTTLFSATMPPAVERLARKYLKKPATITIGEAGRAVDTVEQRVEFVTGDEKKKQRMLEILNSGQYNSPIIVFVNQKKTADMVAKDLSRAGWSTSTLHSGKNQEGREAALQALRTGEADVLVATDLAGRGIDVQDVSLVINYQMAGSIEAYVHRIGRTGRAGKLGTAITFLTNDDDEVMYDLRQEISKSPVSKVPVELAKHEASQHRVTRDMKRKRDTEEGG
ncbi:P-loop containing nucleoside triphosphate hydrolase protein [Coprinellus micaceus]|uniref:RNA helicase n=1 Tax=Coprinellus micaceus TaxID=71717 RepID=A0A4Y7TB74_COPMI|nr:P-loop containing nucleoside triphosphate hydrolase protein [Coprinellus micaceus]